MEHRKLTQDQWLDRAAGGIRFPPDRRAVRAELAGHLEDREEALKRAFPGMPQEEARERALAGMGDPEALRRELSSVHRPLLGWLWLISRWAALGALCLILASLLQRGALFSQGLEYLEQRQEDLLPPGPAAAGAMHPPGGAGRPVAGGGQKHPVPGAVSGLRPALGAVRGPSVLPVGGG